MDIIARMRARHQIDDAVLRAARNYQRLFEQSSSHDLAQIEGKIEIPEGGIM
jgi:hypothetical protein